MSDRLKLIGQLKFIRDYECKTDAEIKAINEAITLLSAELPKEYAKSVWLWMLNYQIKSAELQGRYTPYEVLSWVANDWRKENGLD